MYYYVSHSVSYSLIQIAMGRLAVMEEHWISTLALVRALSQSHFIYQTRIVQVKDNRNALPR